GGRSGGSRSVGAGVKERKRVQKWWAGGRRGGRGRRASQTSLEPRQGAMRAEENQGERSPRCAGQASGGRFLATERGRAAEPGHRCIITAAVSDPRRPRTGESASHPPGGRGSGAPAPNGGGTGIGSVNPKRRDSDMPPALGRGCTND